MGYKEGLHSDEAQVCSCASEAIVEQLTIAEAALAMGVLGWDVGVGGGEPLDHRVLLLPSESCFGKRKQLSLQCQLRWHIQKQGHYIPNKGPSSQGYGFSSSHVWI